MKLCHSAEMREGGGVRGDKREDGKRDESCWRGSGLIYLQHVVCEMRRRPSCGKLGLLAPRPWTVIYWSAPGRVNGAAGPLEQIQPGCAAPATATMDMLPGNVPGVALHISTLTDSVLDVYKQRGERQD